MRYARLDGPNMDLVVEFFETAEGVDIYDIFPPVLIWWPIPEGLNVVEGWTYSDGQFHPPVVVIPDPRPGILAELSQIDRDSARPIRTLIVSAPDIGAGTPERAEIEALEARAVILRAQLEALDT